MTLKISWTDTRMTVSWDGPLPVRPKFQSDSGFLHELKKALNYRGLTFHGEKFDLVKKLMWKDGHLVDDYQHYLRDRRGRYCIYDSEYAIRSLAQDFNGIGLVTLTIHRLSDQ